MEISGWGRFPRRSAEVVRPATLQQCNGILRAHGPLICRGAGRSYGDSSLADVVLNTSKLDRFITFDSQSGVLHCDAGVTLADVVRHFLPKGWFPQITPGTAFVTVGGAIASDVHGKNHHIDGAFSQSLVEIEMLLGSGELVLASRSHNADLFYATCGGMGLTGIIVSARIQLRKVASALIDQVTIKCSGLDEALEAFSTHAHVRYGVAWIDCLAGGKQLGRSIVSVGDHAECGGVALRDERRLVVPITPPGAVLNKTSIGLFNSIYYHTAGRASGTHRVPYSSFFYPLDKVAGWNRLYGGKGFLQYQFVLPREGGVAGMKEILGRITAAGRASFLAVLKAFGQRNDGLLSFPVEGYTLALDFKISPGIFEFLGELDAMVLQFGGRIYLAKDARMTAATFKRAYPAWEEFERVRAKYHAIGKFSSDQSKRLGLS